MEHWWKTTVFYQIYIPSFCDGNGDGIGDFKGILSKLGYLKKLGVSGIWLTPFYSSPKVDQGYDISDYYSIDPDYGTMEDFDALIAEAHSLGIRVISDIVINHTSTEHEWFKQSRSSINNPKRNWYIWKKPVNGSVPNNWESFFGGKAWEYDDATKEYYYHSFAKQQVDLNWANPEVKKAMFQMLDFWIEKGVDGFRLDVINNLTLTGCMKNNPYDEQGKQLHLYDVNQPGIHNFMKELKQYLSRDRDLFLVGEISSDNLETIRSFVGDGQLDTTFNFNLGSMPAFDFDVLFHELSRMAEIYQQEDYPTIFFGSHDMPRVISRFGFNAEQVKNLFTLMMSFRAIPFIYNGDEIGMQSYTCFTKDDARDIQGLLAYHQAKEAGKSEEEAIRILNAHSRDHSRNTMYWDNTVNGGFSEAEPWIHYQKQDGESVSEQMKDSDSLFSYIAELIRIRSTEKALTEGSCEVVKIQESVIGIIRKYGSEKLAAIINFSQNPCVVNRKASDENEEIIVMSRKDAVKQSKDALVINRESSTIIRSH